MISSGANAYHFGNAINMVQALEYCPSDKLIMGNVDPVGVMKMQSAAEVSVFVSRLLQNTSRFHNFVLSTGCDLPPHVPSENIDAFYQALAEFNDSHGKGVITKNAPV
jgi:uroporphyrinogen decarboxylase